MNYKDLYFLTGLNLQPERLADYPYVIDEEQCKCFLKYKLLFKTIEEANATREVMIKARYKLAVSHRKHFQLNFRIRPYVNRDCVYSVIRGSSPLLPEVICFDMDTLECLPVPAVMVWRKLKPYIADDVRNDGLRVFSSVSGNGLFARLVRSCQVALVLLVSRMYSPYGYGFK